MKVVLKCQACGATVYKDVSMKHVHPIDVLKGLLKEFPSRVWPIGHICIDTLVGVLLIVGVTTKE